MLLRPVLLTLVLAAAVTNSADAQRRFPLSHLRSQGSPQLVTGENRLTSSQKAALKSLAQEFNVPALTVDLLEARMNLRTVTRSESATEADIRSAAAQFSEAQVEYLVAMDRFREAVRTSNILTAGQLAQLQRIRERLESAQERALAKIEDFRAANGL